MPDGLPTIKKFKPRGALLFQCILFIFLRNYEQVFRLLSRALFLVSLWLRILLLPLDACCIYRVSTSYHLFSVQRDIVHFHGQNEGFQLSNCRPGECDRAICLCRLLRSTSRSSPTWQNPVIQDSKQQPATRVFSTYSRDIQLHQAGKKIKAASHTLAAKR